MRQMQQVMVHPELGTIQGGSLVLQYHLHSDGCYVLHVAIIVILDMPEKGEDGSRRNFDPDRNSAAVVSMGHPLLTLYQECHLHFLEGMTPMPYAFCNPCRNLGLLFGNLLRPVLMR